MKYTLKNVEEKTREDGETIRLFHLTDSEGKKVEVEGGLWSEGRYYDNSERIRDIVKFGQYVAKQDIGDLKNDFYNVVFYYLTEEQDKELATEGE